MRRTISASKCSGPVRRSKVPASALHSTRGARSISPEARATPTVASCSTKIRATGEPVRISAPARVAARASAAASAPMPPLATDSAPPCARRYIRLSTVPGERGPTWPPSTASTASAPASGPSAISSPMASLALHRIRRRNSRSSGLPMQAQAQRELPQSRRLAPAALGEAWRRTQQHGCQHAGEAGQAVAQVGVGRGIGVRPGRPRSAPCRRS